MRRRATLTLLALTATLALSACGGGEPPAPTAGQSGQGVLAVARSAGLTDFLRAVETANLTETLSGPGPFTLFVPTNRAFSAAGQPRDAEQAAVLVASHVVPGTFTTDFLAGMDANYTTLTGKSVAIDGTNGLIVGGATVITADLVADNGVVHIIDRVLTPK